MCGLAGFAGVKDENKRLGLVLGLGFEIDSRGGHAAGYVTIGNGIRHGTKLGHWATASDEFLDNAASGSIALLHARWATCGKRTIDEAHPFNIQRDGKTVLYGAHNGMIYNAEDSALAHNRPYTVDSKELFELLADANYEVIESLSGYGVITWIEPGTDAIYLARISESSEIFVVRTKCGAVVYGSTKEIVKRGLKFAGMKMKTSYTLEVGRVYEIRSDGIFGTHRPWIEVSKRFPTFDAGPYSWDGEEDDFETWYLKEYGEKWEDYLYDEAGE